MTVAIKIPEDMELIYEYPEAMTTTYTHYCPGCPHGIVHRLVAEVIDELGIREKCIGVAPVGCSVMIYKYLNMDFVEAAHGRAPAMATGLKRTNPDKIVFTYQGDGDIAAIGTAEALHAANRGELITTVFINNAIYGMTGGQMAPTTLPGMVTTSTPFGRDVRLAGYPVPMSELLAQIEGAVYVTRQMATDLGSIRKTKKAIKRAFMAQLAGLGYSSVEVLSSCSTNWNMGPWEALEWVKEKMIPYFPLGVFKMTDEVKALKVK